MANDNFASLYCKIGTFTSHRDPCRRQISRYAHNRSYYSRQIRTYLPTMHTVVREQRMQVGPPSFTTCNLFLLNPSLSSSTHQVQLGCQIVISIPARLLNVLECAACNIDENLDSSFSFPFLPLPLTLQPPTLHPNSR